MNDQSSYQRIDRDQLKRMLETSSPDNRSEEEGYALVNVLKREAFDEQHIPGSINIPLVELDEFERRFDKSKEIVVYCASPECSASPDAARELSERGFARVSDYEGGMSDWKQGGHPVEAG